MTKSHDIVPIDPRRKVKLFMRSSLLSFCNKMAVE